MENGYYHPVTFVDGAKYLWIERAKNEEEDLVPVWFDGYYSCPAFIIVSNAKGQKLRLPRDELFISPA